MAAESRLQEVQSAENVEANEWSESVTALLADIEAFKKMIEDPATNLYSTIPWGEGQTILREILLSADHTSYHLGQIVFLRKQLDATAGYSNLLFPAHCELPLQLADRGLAQHALKLFQFSHRVRSVTAKRRRSIAQIIDQRGDRV